MTRLDQLYRKLGLNKRNGLFLLAECDKWIHEFPYRIGRILKEVIKPDAFFCLYGEEKLSTDHPQPFNEGFVLFFENPNTEEENLIHTRIINFGLAQAVFINRPNSIDVYHGNEFSMKRLNKLKSSSDLKDFEGFSFINQLIGNTVKRLGVKKNLIDTYLLNNITDARRILIAPDGLKLLPQAANRLIGRLLFVSYLIDRDVTFNDQSIITGITKAERKASFKLVIKDKTALYKFFKYLNNKYDGDMFPLKEFSQRELVYDEENTVQIDHLLVLSYLFNCSEFFAAGKSYKGYYVQESLFDLYDFEIIPVELISSIYENFIGNESENEKLKLSKQKEIKAYYTPPYLVDYVLSQTVTPFLNKRAKTDSNCRVLDPSCGSGIFLVETLRKIIEKERSLSASKKISDSKLWKLIKRNIYGIDIDSDAIDISIFSLYVTILDYKQPAEIENFKFQRLKDENFFGGIKADFFNVNHPFNSLVKDLDFIIGNPPWGQVKQSSYIDYIKRRRELESKNKNRNTRLDLEIGNKEICQAFMIRTSDFLTSSKQFHCCFIVSSKVLYNTNASSKKFRSYFLQKFSVKQVVELSPVNNKIRGHNHIFEHARQPAAIVTFKPEIEIGVTKENIVQHITVKPNKFFIYYKTIVIEKHDVKNIKQEYFIEKYNGFDWLWKILVHGNVLDIHFIKRLTEGAYTVGQYLKENNYDTNGGLKLVDGARKYDSTPLSNYDYLDAELGFRQFSTTPYKKWKKLVGELGINDFQIGYLPDLKFFEGDKLLIKKGVVLNPQQGEHHFGAITAFNDKKICFTSTVCSIKSTSNSDKNSKTFLSALSGLFNSKLFTYFLLNTSSSAGIERSRIHFEEFFKFPLHWNKRLSSLALQITNQRDSLDGPMVDVEIRNQIENEVNKLYNISEVELALIDCALNISIPILLREESYSVFKALNFRKENDQKYISTYATIILKSFESRFLNINKFLNSLVTYSDNFIRIDFTISDEQNFSSSFSSVENDDLKLLLGDLGVYQVCRDLYFQQDVRGFTEKSFYIIKPNEKKLWHPAVAYLDALEFDEEITKAEIKKIKKESVL